MHQRLAIHGTIRQLGGPYLRLLVLCSQNQREPTYSFIGAMQLVLQDTILQFYWCYVVGPEDTNLQFYWCQVPRPREYRRTYSFIGAMYPLRLKTPIYFNDPEGGGINPHRPTCLRLCHYCLFYYIIRILLFSFLHQLIVYTKKMYLQSIYIIYINTIHISSIMSPRRIFGHLWRTWLDTLQVSGFRVYIPILGFQNMQFLRV